MNKQTVRRILAIGLALVGLSGGSLPVEAVFHERESQQHGEWVHSPWYGWYDATYHPNIYHLEHGWQLCVAVSDSSLLLYDYGMSSYVWTSDGLYPWIYKFGANANWYYYCRGGKVQERWFMLSSAAVYIHEGAIVKEPLVPSIERKVARPRMIP